MYVTTPSTTDQGTTTVQPSHDISALTPAKKSCCGSCSCKKKKSSCGGGTSGLGSLGGLFDSGLDLTGWGFGEWMVVGAGVYFAWKIFSDLKGGVTGTRKFLKRRSSRRRRYQLMADAEKI